MENARKTMRNILYGGFWPSLVVMIIAALEFVWLEQVLGDELIAAILTIATPLPLASLLSRSFEHRKRRRNELRDPQPFKPAASFRIDNGKISAMYVVRNPDKLKHLH